MKRKKKMPIAPEISDKLILCEGLDETLRDSLYEGDDVEGLRFAGIAFDDLVAHRASFRGCVFDKCTFDIACEVDTFDFLDCAFIGCDFAGMSMPKAALQRVSFSGCRAVGMHLSDAYLRNVTFDDCQMSYANFGSAKIYAVCMTRCEMEHATFGYATFEHMAFDGCRLTGAEFFGTKLAGIDLRTCQIDGIVLGDRSELVGAIVTSMQALSLMHLLGIVIED